MNKYGMLTIVCLLLSAPFAAALITDDSENDSGTRSLGIDHALVHFNVTYPNGSPAQYVYVNIHYYYSQYTYVYRDHDKTDQDGIATIPVSDYNYGLCRITIHDFDLNYYWSIPYFIGPGDEIYLDVVLTEPLPYDREVTGVVRDESMSPLENVMVRISGYDAQGMYIDVNDTTGSDGVYSINVPEPMINYQMEAPYGSTDYYGVYVNIYTMEESEIYTYDIDLVPVYVQDVPVKIRMMNGSSGEPIPYTQISVSGFNADKDHGYDYPTVTNKTDEDGWVNATLGMGEWWIYWYEHNTIFQNGSIASTMPFLVNSTSSPVEFPVPVFDQFRTVYVNLTDKDTGDPLGPAYSVRSSAYIKARETPQVEFYQRVDTDSHGLANFQIPAGIDVTVRFNDWWSYESKLLTIEAGPPSEDVVLNISLAEEDPLSIPTGDLSILVTDPVSGLPLTDAYIYGQGTYNEIGVYMSGYTNEFGYMNKTGISVGTYDLMADSKVGLGQMDDVIVNEGEKTEYTIEVVRTTIPEDNPFMEFRVNDTAGNPISGIPIMFTKVQEFMWSYYEIISDAQGVIHVSLPPGDYRAYIPVESSSTSKYRFRNHWVMETAEFSVDESGAPISDFTAYDVSSLDPVTGTIKDMETGSIMPYQGVSAESSLFIGETRTRPMMSGPPGSSTRGDDYLRSYHQDYYSTTSGYYRVWGRDVIDIRCEREGYFPYLETIDMTTRAPAELDIYLEPLKEYTTWVNGTILDQEDNPIPGSLRILDLERDLYLINGTDTIDGIFNLTVYPGSFLVEYGNETLSDSIEVTVTEEGLENLSLHLIPMSMINATIKNWNGTLLEGINVTLQEMVSLDVYETIDWMITESDGLVHFEAPKGSYSLFIELTELYDPYTGDLLESTGWNDFQVNITLGNRTIADITGSVVGITGPMTDGIFNATVTLTNSTGHVLSSGQTNETGIYALMNVSHGTNYTIEAVPPSDLQPNEELYRSGYESGIITGINVSGVEVEVDFGLEYTEYTPPGYLNVTTYGPTGENVSVNEYIYIVFSESVNMTSLEEGFTISPDPGNISFDRLGMTNVVWVYHDLFEEFTTYTITLSGNIYSETGLPLWNSGGITWNFTTFNMNISWALFTSEVIHDEGKSYDAIATGMGFLDVYMVIEGVRSYLMEETSQGVYEYHLDGSMFEWDTSYNYHFSDRENGTDMAPLIAGMIWTPEEPVQIDPITSADIEVDEDGSWIVTVHGDPGQTLYIVIDGVGSFLLDETENGTYTTTIPGDEFEEGETYDYYFSDTPDGDDISPGSSGSMATEEESTTSSSFSPFMCCGIGLIAVLVAIIVIVLVIVVATRGKGEEGWDEE